MNLCYRPMLSSQHIHLISRFLERLRLLFHCARSCRCHHPCLSQHRSYHCQYHCWSKSDHYCHNFLCDRVWFYSSISPFLCCSRKLFLFIVTGTVVTSLVSFKFVLIMTDIFITVSFDLFSIVVTCFVSSGFCFIMMDIVITFLVSFDLIFGIVVISIIAIKDSMLVDSNSVGVFAVNEVALDIYFSIPVNSDYNNAGLVSLVSTLAAFFAYVGMLNDFMGRAIVWTTAAVFDCISRQWSKSLLFSTWLQLSFVCPSFSWILTLLLSNWLLLPFVCLINDRLPVRWCPVMSNGTLL